MTQTACGVSPLAALCLQTIRRWWNVVRRGRGGQLDANGTPWTRLPAAELLAQLEREHGITPSIRGVRRALQSLADGGHLRREQRYAHRWKRDYWYAPTEAEQALDAHRPSRIAAAQSQAVRSGSPRPIERPPVAAQDLGLPLSSSNLKAAGPQPNSRAASRQDGGRGFGAWLQGPAQRLQEAVQRAHRLGSQAATAAQAERREEGGRVYAQVGGHWVVDDARTAPIR